MDRTYGIERELEISANTRTVSPPSLDGTITTSEYLQACCRITYRMRKVKNKGAILVLVWSFLVMSVYSYLFDTILPSYHNSIIYSVFATIGVTLPFAGWLADVRFGRYKMICFSIWTMWISSMLLAMKYVTFSLMEFNEHQLMSQILTILLLIVLTFGLGVYQANIIQFGVDQLNDASTTEITSFVAWYTWTLISSNIFTSLINMLVCFNSKYYLMGPLLIAINLTIIVITNYMFSNQLIKEPVIQNPFKLIYKVVRYAIKNKYPQQRSAFTYWEDNLPSRIDFGKIKYGGPFTTEQVEDVKMFLKMLGIVFIASWFVSVEFNFHRLEFYTTYLTELISINHSFIQCFYKDFFDNIFIITGLLLIPLNEFLLYPLFYRCITIKSHWKFGIGTLLQLSGFIVLIILVTYSRSKYVIENDDGLSYNNHTVQCLFHLKFNPLINKAIDYRWFAVTEVLLAISFTVIVIGIIEFYCAQVPYSMKGLMAGTHYCFLGFCVVFGYGLSRVFRLKLHIWETKTIFSCGFWYLLTKIILITIAILMTLLMVKYHKNRKREDILPNEHIFAEQYYSVQNSGN